MDQTDVSSVIRQVATLVTTRYVFPDVGQALSDLLGKQLDAGHYSPAVDLAALAELVTIDLQSLNGDKHLRLLHSDEEVLDETDEAAEVEAFTKWAALHSGGIAKVERLEDNVGYLNLRPILFPVSIAGDCIAAAMTLIATTDALVIDVRECLGGDPSMVAMICSYLFGYEPVHLLDIFERHADGDKTRQCWTLPFVPGRLFGPTKKIYVLTSGVTFSGAEDLSFDLQELGRAVIVGERTGGGAHPREGFRVHPHLEATIPIARGISPRTGTNWEGTGVVPDIEVPAADALDNALRLARDALRQDS